MSSTTHHSLGNQLKRDKSIVVEAFKRFSSDKCTTLAASIAFYSAFSLAPTLLVVLAIVGWVYGAEAARGQLFAQINGFVGNDAAAAIQTIVENAHKDNGGGIAAITSIVLLIVGASATFSSLNTALDVVFPGGAAVRERSSVALMVRMRLVSFSLVLGIAFLLIVSLVLDAAVTFASKMIWGDSPLAIVTNLVQALLALVVLACAFTALLKWLPDTPVHWKDAGAGGLTSAILFTVGKKLFALYLAHAGTASAFGAAGSLAVLMMWLFFSSAVLLVGAEIAAARGGYNALKDVAPVPPGEPAKDTETPSASAQNPASLREAGVARNASPASSTVARRPVPVRHIRPAYHAADKKLKKVPGGPKAVVQDTLERQTDRVATAMMIARTAARVLSAVREDSKARAKKTAQKRHRVAAKHSLGGRLKRSMYTAVIATAAGAAAAAFAGKRRRLPWR